MSERRDWVLWIRVAMAAAVGVLVNLLLVALLAVVVVPLFGSDGDPGVGGSVETAFATGLQRLASPPGLAAILALGVVLATLQGVRAVRGGRRAVTKRSDAERDRDLETRVGKLAQVAGVPVPSVWVVPAEEANCFTLGRSGNAALVVTGGLLDALDEDQLDAVLAHELAHVASHDVGALTVLLGQLRSAVGAINWGLRGAFVFFCVTVLTAVGTVVGVDGVTVGFLAAVLVVDAYVVLSVAALVTFLLATTWAPRRFSQYREFVADRFAARITGNPAALASALRELDGVDRPETDLRSSAGRALWLLSGRTVQSGRFGALGRLLGTFESDAGFPPGETVDSLTQFHPPVEERIDRLRTLAERRATGPERIG